MFVRPVFLSFKLIIHYLVEKLISGGTVVPVRGIQLVRLTVRLLGPLHNLATTQCSPSWRTTLGLRSLPIFFFSQNEPGFVVFPPPSVFGHTDT